VIHFSAWWKRIRQWSRYLRSEKFIGSIARLQYCCTSRKPMVWRYTPQNFRLSALMKNENCWSSFLSNRYVNKNFDAWLLLKPSIGYFRYGRGQLKAYNTYAEKIAFGKPSVWRFALSTQFFRHRIDRSVYWLLPLDSLTFALLRFGRLAAVLWVMIDSPLNAIADCRPSDGRSRLLHRRRIEKWKGKCFIINFWSDKIRQSLAGINHWQMTSEFAEFRNPLYNIKI